MSFSVFFFSLDSIRTSQKEFRTSFHTNSSGTTVICQTRIIWKRELLVLVWIENILKTELFENDDITMLLDDFGSLCIL